MSSDTKLPLAVCIVCIDPVTGNVLAATRPGTTDCWGFIGGKVDPGETIRQAARREFFEETGVELKDVPIREIVRIDDTHDYDVTVFQLYRHQCHDVKDILMARHGEDHFSVEPGILVGYVPMTTVCNSPFAEFNTRLLSILLANSLN